MRKWKTLAAPDDPNVWSDVQNMWPTGRGTYEVCDTFGTATDISATGESKTSLVGFWAFNGLSATRAFVVGKKIWEIDSGVLTDRTGSLGSSTVASGSNACQYGDVTILARGTSAALVGSTPGNAFTAIGGAPSAKIVAVQSDCVAAFNTSSSSDGWATSDVGDYTNWSTGEAASGRILQNNGPILAAVPFGNDFIIGKSDSIYRMTYVGGVVKWQIQKIAEGIGVSGQSSIVVCGPRIFFYGYQVQDGTAGWFVFDGVSLPQSVSIDVRPSVSTSTSKDFISRGSAVYDPISDRVTVYCATALVSPRWAAFFYSFRDDAWGAGELTAYNPAFTSSPIPVQGDFSAIIAPFGTGQPGSLRGVISSKTDNFTYQSVFDPGISRQTAYVQTSLYGDVTQKTAVSRVTPLLRRRTNSTAGSAAPAATLNVDLFTERDDASASQSQTGLAESTVRKRFDILSPNTDTFVRCKAIFTDMDVEVDDLLLTTKTTPAN